MPNNTQKIVLELAPSQAQVAAHAKLLDAVKQMGGGAQAAGGKVSGTFADPAAMGDWMKQQKEAAKDLNMKLGKMSVSQTEGGDYKATADIQKKAFSSGGMVAGIATVVGGIGAGFTKLLGLSQVFSTFMSTTGKILGTAVDLMLAPLMPVFVKIMVWIIQSVFPLATKIGNWVGGVLGDISGGGAVAALTAGYVGLKVAGSVLDSLGKSLGNALLSHFDADSFGGLITGGISNSVGKLKDWGETAALHIMEGMDKATEVLSGWYETIAGGISSAFSSVSGTLSHWYDTVAGGISDAFSSVVGKLSGWYDTIAGGISDAFSTVSSTIGKWYETVAGGISSAFGSVVGTLGKWYETVAGGIASAFDSVVGTLGKWYETVAGGITDAFSSVVGKLSDWYSTIAEGISTAISTTADTLKQWGSTIGLFITTGIKDAKNLLADWGKTVGGFVASGIKGTGAALAGTWKAIGGFIGSSIGAVGTAWNKIGRAIGNAVGNSGGWAKMGGMIGAGLGVVAIGAAIGYAMWKTYQKYQEGKDITAGLDRVGQLQMMTEQYGLSQDQAAAMIGGIERGGISTSDPGFGNLVETFSQVATEFEVWGQISHDRLQAMSIQEQGVLAGMLRRGEMGGDPSAWAGGWDRAIQILEGRLEGYDTPYSQKGLVTGIQTTAQFTEAEDFGGGFKGHFVQSNISSEMQLTIMKHQNNMMREQLDELYGTSAFTEKNLWGFGGYKKDLPANMSELAFITGAAEGDVAMSYLEKSDRMRSILGDSGVYGPQEVEGLAKTINLNFVLNSGQVERLSASDIAGIIELLEKEAVYHGVALGTGPD